MTRGTAVDLTWKQNSRDHNLFTQQNYLGKYPALWAVWKKLARMNNLNSVHFCFPPPIPSATDNLRLLFKWLPLETSLIYFKLIRTSLACIKQLSDIIKSKVFIKTRLDSSFERVAGLGETGICAENGVCPACCEVWKPLHSASILCANPVVVIGNNKLFEDNSSDRCKSRQRINFVSYHNIQSASCNKFYSWLSSQPTVRGQWKWRGRCWIKRPVYTLIT